MDEELRKAIEEAKEQQAVAIDLKWYADVKLSEIKQFIRAEINTVSRTFVSIGYYLKYIRDKQLYKDDGYTGITEFAKAEFGISAAQASKFMSINDKFSVDGNSPILLEQYRDFSSSKLSEMLYLTDEQLEHVTVATTVAEIREIKEPEKEASFSTSKTESEEVDPVAEPEPTQSGLPPLRNNDQRAEWLKNYQEWGLWYQDDNIDARYYKFDFSDGSRVVAVQYKSKRYRGKETPDGFEWSYPHYHLIGSKDKYNVCWHEFYDPYEDSVTVLIEHLKNVQKKKMRYL